MEWNEKDIIEACKKQNKQAQMALLHKYQNKFLGICLRYVDNQHIAEEILMDAFMAIFQKIKLYQENSFEGWMKTIVIHKSIDYYRKHKNDPIITNIETAEWRAPKKQQENSLETEDLLALLISLPTGYRVVFNLYAIEGYSHKEIAQRLGVSVSTSKTQLHKAKLKLQELITKGGYHD
ncbi:MAG: sigma-70 family RNA polymerase sigma factor [Bacteroidales bacterium]|nr:sigma-70 family RNA polymerase sigma factor [Bacteroidales bacterium]